MTMPVLRCFALLALLSSGVVDGGAAVAVYRCGNAYSDVPCPQATVVDVDDRRSDADRAAARDTALREAALAASLGADRLRAESPSLVRRAARARAPGRAASATASRQRPARRSRHEDEDGDFVVVLPKVKRTAALR